MEHQIPVMNIPLEFQAYIPQYLDWLEYLCFESAAAVPKERGIEISLMSSEVPFFRSLQRAAPEKFGPCPFPKHLGYYFAEDLEGNAYWHDDLDVFVSKSGSQVNVSTGYLDGNIVSNIKMWRHTCYGNCLPPVGPVNVAILKFGMISSFSSYIPAASLLHVARAIANGEGHLKSFAEKVSPFIAEHDSVVAEQQEILSRIKEAIKEANWQTVEEE